MKSRKKKINHGVTLADACADMAYKLMKRGEFKSALSWLKSAQYLLRKA